MFRAQERHRSLLDGGCSRGARIVPPVEPRTISARGRLNRALSSKSATLEMQLRGQDRLKVAGDLGHWDMGQWNNCLSGCPRERRYILLARSNSRVRPIFSATFYCSSRESLRQ